MSPQLSGSGTTGRRDNQSPDCRSGSGAVATIHLNQPLLGQERAEGRKVQESRKRGAEEEILLVHRLKWSRSRMGVPNSREDTTLLFTSTPRLLLDRCISKRSRFCGDVPWRAFWRRLRGTNVVGEVGFLSDADTGRNGGRQTQLISFLLVCVGKTRCDDVATFTGQGSVGGSGCECQTSETQRTLLGKISNANEDL